MRLGNIRSGLIEMIIETRKELDKLDPNKQETKEEFIAQFEDLIYRIDYIYVTKKPRYKLYDILIDEYRYYLKMYGFTVYETKDGLTYRSAHDRMVIKLCPGKLEWGE